MTSWRHFKAPDLLIPFHRNSAENWIPPCFYTFSWRVVRMMSNGSLTAKGLILVEEHVW
jgi:hypothetical protein